MAVTVQSGSVFHGRTEGSGLGYALSAAGDIDGDGFGDLVFGAPNATRRATSETPLVPLAGEAVLVLGRPGGFAPQVDLALDPATAIFTGSQAFAALGSAVAGGGDLDGDGRDDLLIGAPFRDDGLTVDTGTAYAIFGSAATAGGWRDGAPAAGSVGLEIPGQTVRSYAGFSVAILGDVDGDGLADAAVGSPGASFGFRFGAGSVGVSLAGGGDRDGGGGRVTIHGAAALDYAGAAVASAGDVNGDGLADILIGAPLADAGARDSGAAYVVFGRADGWQGDIDLASLPPGGGIQFRGPASGALAGVSVAAAGDVNGDGLGDIAIGAPGAGPAGSVFVVFGRAGPSGGAIDLAALDGTDGFRIDGAGVGDRFGSAVAGVGDVDGDGRDDLLIGAPQADRSGLTDAGAAFLVLGREDGAASVAAGALGPGAGYRFDGARSFSGTGIGVAPGGDVNGDGWADLMIGADRMNPGGRNDAGAIYLVHGGPGVLAGLDGLDGALDGRIGLERVGAGVSVAEDLLSPPGAGGGPTPENPPETNSGGGSAGGGPARDGVIEAAASREAVLDLGTPDGVRVPSAHGDGGRGAEAGYVGGADDRWTGENGAPGLISPERAGPAGGGAGPAPSPSPVPPDMESQAIGAAGSAWTPWTAPASLPDAEPVMSDQFVFRLGNRMDADPVEGPEPPLLPGDGRLSQRGDRDDHEVWMGPAVGIDAPPAHDHIFAPGWHDGAFVFGL